MKIFGKNKQSGFSLVELMIVVGIIGVLATLALPRFKQFQSKAKMAEAMNVLQHVYTLEQSYSLDNNAFITVQAVGANLGTPNTNNCNFNGNAATLGLVIEPCPQGVNSPTPRFQYEVTTPGGTSTFMAIARTGGAANNRICPGNAGFAIGLSDRNATSWGVGNNPPAAPNGAVVVGSVCAN